MEAMPTDRPPIGLKIRRARERLRISQVKLAVMVGVSQKTIDNWENDRSYPRSAIGALEEILGPLTADRTPAAQPARDDYPDFVGTDRGFQHIWDIPHELISDEEREWLILQLQIRRLRQITHAQEHRNVGGTSA